MEDLRETFFLECEELSSEISDGLSALESDPSNYGIVDAVFRAVHSIKGGAGSFCFSRTVQLAHQFETALDLVRSGERFLDQAKILLLLRTADRLEDELQSAFEKEELTDDVSEEIEAELARIFDISGEEEQEPDFSVQTLDFGMFDLGDPSSDASVGDQELKTALPVLTDAMKVASDIDLNPPNSIE